MYSRIPVQIRIAEKPLKKIDKAATDYGLTRADVIRACLAVAFWNWESVEGQLDQKAEEV